MIMDAALLDFPRTHKLPSHPQTSLAPRNVSRRTFFSPSVALQVCASAERALVCFDPYSIWPSLLLSDRLIVLAIFSHTWMLYNEYNPATRRFSQEPRFRTQPWNSSRSLCWPLWFFAFSPAPHASSCRNPSRSLCEYLWFSCAVHFTRLSDLITKKRRLLVFA
ncbi:hypothetical protein PLICRDRAFT_377495 [Plicaturopsis crispa FD-325 SS-3]|nr:hypothetical protein PLICRDRAFT_377495 [Plicaturopsis crispa FD-325 SS-3]